VFSDEFPEMRRQAMKIAAWQSNVYVKIPITNTRNESSLPLVRELAKEGVQLNVTAILTEKSASECLEIVPGMARAPAGGQQDLGEVSDGYRHEWGWLNEDRCCQQVTF